jgi:type IV secretion system protein TrbG
MNRLGYPNLVLWGLIAAGTAAADQQGASPPPAGSPAEATVPNTPAEQSDSQGDNAPNTSTDSSAGLALGAQTGTVKPMPPTAPPTSLPMMPTTVPSLSPPVVLPAPTPPSAQPCVNADCAAPLDKPANAARSKVYIGPPAQRALAESHAWAENPDAMPTRDSGGRVIFTFSDSAPTVVCAPMHICDIELQPGEVVLGAPHVGDAVRWKISPALSGSDELKTIHLIVKPTEAGLDTNLIVPTDRRTYHLRLVSSFDRYVSAVGFFYSEEDQQAWKELARTGARGAGGGSGAAEPDMPTVAVNRLNFDYKIKVVKGKPLFKPLRAMDDGYHTYIAMNEDLPQAEAPALIGISHSGEEQMLNYRLKGNIYVIDGMVYKVALVSGAGSEQQRIELQRNVCQRRGWLGICWDPKE